MTDWFGTAVVLIIFAILIVGAAFVSYDVGYRAGQLDALNGKIHYRLERQANNEFIWVECPDVCEREDGE